jgi:hypothetical protein
MARLLNELEVGTRVFDADGAPAGEVRATYGLGGSHVVEYLLVYWSARGEVALISSDEVASYDDAGITLFKSASSYESLPAFDPAANPELHRLSAGA